MITKVKWKNYKALGNLELDFTNATGEPYNTIVLAGENGTGKTTVLESILNIVQRSQCGRLSLDSPFADFNPNIHLWFPIISAYKKDEIGDPFRGSLSHLS